MGLFFMIIGIVTVVIWLFWLVTERFPKVGNSIGSFANKSITYLKSLFSKRKDKKNKKLALNE